MDSLPNIGLIGRRRVGKDTVAKILVEQYGYERLAFADPLREAALALNPIVCIGAGEEEWRLARVVETIGWEAAKDRYPEVRRILQRLGDEAGRRIHGPDLWVRHMERRLRGATGPVVVTDVRYRNEAAVLRGQGFRLVRVVRPVPTSSDPADVAGHASETELATYRTDETLVNNGSLDDLARRVAVLVGR